MNPHEGALTRAAGLFRTKEREADDQQHGTVISKILCCQHQHIWTAKVSVIFVLPSQRGSISFSTCLMLGCAHTQEQVEGRCATLLQRKGGRGRKRSIYDITRAGRGRRQTNH
jgi:hypothetical protein